MDDSPMDKVKEEIRVLRESFEYLKQENYYDHAHYAFKLRDAIFALTNIAEELANHEHPKHECKNDKRKK